MKIIIPVVLVTMSFGAAADGLPKTSEEALAACNSFNSRFGIVEDCRETSQLYHELSNKERFEASKLKQQEDAKLPPPVIPKTSAEAFEQCEAHNLRFGRTDDCRNDFVYKSMKEVEVNRAKQAKSEKAAKAKAARPGVRIGMTQAQVVNGSNWGKPQKINRTTTRYGTSEQWVYGNGNYLYFENGVLTSIQN